MRRSNRRRLRRELDAMMAELLADWFERDPMFLSEVA